MKSQVVPSRGFWAGLSGTSFVMLVLVGSVAVAAVLAWQATNASQQRQRVIEAVVRDYARLAALEFSREAAKDIDLAIMHSLAARIHPTLHTGENPCDCEPITEVDEWFEDRTVRSAGVELGTMDGRVRMRRSDTDGRIVASRWDAHVGPSGGEVGFVIKPAALRSVLDRTHRRAVLLSSLVGDSADVGRLVHLRVSAREGGEIFASSGTVAGPQGFEAALLPDSRLDLRIHTSMVPAFVSSLGTEYGVSPKRPLVFGLVWVNGILVAIGLWQLARERELSRLRSDFVAGVSHELRTPLAQIRMFAETLLLDRIRNPTEGRRALEIISRETRRLGQLVDNVLIFHRHERVQPPSVIEDVELDSLIRDVVGNFEPLAAARQSTVRYEAGMSRAVVRGNPDGLRQVILNLLDNAFKFGPSGQTVRVAQEDSQESVRIIVEDSGPGIPPHDRQRVFKAFERGRNTRGAGGAGIGLAVVRQIVGAHNGTVAVETAASGGARFIVTLPATDRPSDEAVV